LDFGLHVLSQLVFSFPQLFILAYPNIKFAYKGEHWLIYSLEAFLTVSPEVVETVGQDGLPLCQLISALVKQRSFLFPFKVKKFHDLLDLCRVKGKISLPSYLLHRISF